MNKSDVDGSVYMVLVNGEFAGWFSIPTGTTETKILRAGLSSNPTIIDMEDVEIDIKDLPKQASGYFWNGKKFEKRDSIGN